MLTCFNKANVSENAVFHGEVHIAAIIIAAFYPWCLCVWIFIHRANNAVVLHCVTNLLVFIRSIQASWVICFYHLAFIIEFSSKYLKLDQIFSPVFILACFINIIIRYLDINSTIFLFWYSDEILRTTQACQMCFAFGRSWTFQSRLGCFSVFVIMNSYFWGNISTWVRY